MTAAEFQHIAASIPRQPGIYKYYDNRDELLYVGKAKELRKRVSSYFSKTLTSYKTHELVKRIGRIEYTIVNSEQDAFLLENSLIKEFQPRYNINLKDDKTYPFIVIKKEPFPRVFLTRKKIDDGSVYLGPFTSVKRVRELMDFIKQTIQLRNCTLNLSEQNIRKGKFKVCLEYHLGNCKGPCEGLQSAEDYEENLAQLRNLLKGNLGPVIRHFRAEMKELVAALAFEKAEAVRKKIEFLENYQSRSVVVSTRTGDLDVFSFTKEPEGVFVSYLMIRNGAIIQTHTSQVESKLDESPGEILGFTVARLRAVFNSDAREVVLPFAIDYPQQDLEITVPKGGDRKKLLELAEKNSRQYTEGIRQKQRLQLNKPSTDKMAMLQQLQEDLQLQELPVHIECFDNSHFQGSYPVSAMVCFKNGIPSKSDYRHFNVRTVEGINDFATMKEAVYRRYKRLKEEDQPFPQLIIIDGGKGQLSAALEAMEELQLGGVATLVGLAKNEEELFFAGDRESLKLPYNGDSLRFIRLVRDEVHRFGIGFHRRQRSKGTFTNELEQIPGIGKATAERLLKEFRSIKNIRAATQEELEKLVGPQRTKQIKDYFLQIE